MTAKEYLQQVYRAKKEVRRLQLARDHLREEMYSLRSPSGNMTPDKVQSSVTGDKIEKLIAQVDETERELVAQQERWLELYRTVTRQIEAMPNELHREILFQRYVLCKRWPRISRDLDYDQRYVYRLHGEALVEFTRTNLI